MYKKSFSKLTASEERARVHDHQGGECDSRQGSTVLKKWLRAYMLIHRHEAEKASMEWHGIWFPNLKALLQPPNLTHTFFNKCTPPNSSRMVSPTGDQIFKYGNHSYSNHHRLHVCLNSIYVLLDFWRKTSNVRSRTVLVAIFLLHGKTNFSLL